MRRAQVAGASGGAAEAVVDGETGLVVGDPRSARRGGHLRCAACSTTRERGADGRGGPARAEHEFAYDVLAARLAAALDQASTRRPPT